MKPVSETATDAGESPSSMEPMLIAEGAARMEGLREQALELSEAAAEFRGRLPATLREPLAALVRSMNCYYSNLIEGHDTHPVDIERALNDDYSNDPGKRALQLEATAHIRVQRTIDEGHLTYHPLTPSGLAEIHARFCEHLPDSLLWVDDPKGGDPVRVVPGQWRDRDVAVDRHVPISTGAIPRFMERFAARYSNLGRISRLLAPACAHHRLLWIHPFIDGNGRVARLMSHALLVESLRTGGVWSVVRARP
jgi:Fic family protein